MLEIKNVLVPIDFSENAQGILEAAASVAGGLGAHLSMVFVVQNFDDYSGFFVPAMNLPNLVEELYQSAEQRMETFAEENKELCEKAGVSEVTAKVLTGDVAEEIMGYAADNKMDMIVMGTHGYKGLERVLFGSVAEKVVKNACCPVLTVNPYRMCKDAGEKED